MNTIEIFKALTDETRIRILFILLYEPLCVNEILTILKMGQSRISRHLKILLESEILKTARNGSKIYYGISPEFRMHPLYDALVHLKKNNGSSDVDNKKNFYWSQETLSLFEQDQKMVFQLLEQRKSDSIAFFERFGDLLEVNQHQYVDANYYRERIIELLPLHKNICIEPGCGTGWVSSKLVDHVKKLYCIDQSITSLNKIKQKLNSQQLKKIELIPAPMEEIPLKDQCADLIVLSMALHHTPNITKVLQESYRLLKKHGTLIIAELEHHSIEEMRKKFADFWLGFHLENLKKELSHLNYKILETHKGKGKGKLNCIFIKCIKS